MNLKRAILYRKKIYITKNLDKLLNRNYKGNKYKVNKSFIDINKINEAEYSNDIYESITRNFINHRFNYLGSGWKKVSINAEIEIDKRVSQKDMKFCKEIYNKISYKNDYELIDWQLDYKTNKRFSEQVWGIDNLMNNDSLDIKCPWELSRLYHLVTIAIYALKNPKERSGIILEYKNQILDFIAFNPVKMGANWNCSMEIAIRAINMLVSYDIFKQIDDEKQLDDEFHKILSNSIFDHGCYIITNLEVNDNFSGNHYLSDLSGLIYICSYLNNTKKTDKWLEEASTYYHRLSTEIALYTTPFILKQVELNKINLNIKNDESIYRDYFSRLKKSIDFLVNVSKNNFEMPQIGDNDSGRIIKLTYQGNIDMLNNNEFEENDLLVNQIISLSKGIFNDESIECDKLLELEEAFVRTLMDGRTVKIDSEIKEEVDIIESPLINEMDLKCNSEYVINFDEYNFILEIEELKKIVYHEFGLIILKNDNFYLSFRLGDVGQNGKGGHAHNDNLSLNLRIKDKDVFSDPGTYVYTSNKELRNLYRSNKSHNNPYIEGIEYNDFNGIFGLKEVSEYKLTRFDNRNIEAYVVKKDIVIQRKVEITEGYIKIVDKANREFKSNFFNNTQITRGYGKY